MSAEHYQAAVLRRMVTRLREIHHHLHVGRTDLARIRVADLDREVQREAAELESLINADLTGSRNEIRSEDSL